MATADRNRSWRIGVDIGGTFTDLVAYNSADGRTVTAKSLTTPRRPVEGVLQVLENAATPLAEASGFVHGSTVAINAILQQNGAATALMTTKGFRDVLEMGRKNRADMYNLFFRPRVCLVPRERRFEVDERLRFDGEVLTELDLERVAELAESLPAEVEAVAICFLHAYANPAHERAAAEALSAARPELYVTTSTDISGEAREYERTSTAVANAYIGPLVARYIEELETELGSRGLESPLLITQSNGGVMPPRMAVRQPIRTTESGPAAGVNGAAWLGRELDLGDLIAFDMGGTTAKACVVRDGEPEMTSEYSIGGELTGIPVQVPFIEVVEVGAGGGSVAYMDATGALRVGPRSAGAEPGPAAYARGGVEPTVTDANVVVGKIAPASFLEGKMRLDDEAAAEAVGGLAGELEIDLHDCANGIVRVANAIMAAAIRAVTIERGRDPRDFTMVAYGGAGPVHAIALADELGVPKVVIPARSGTFAAFGMLVTNLRHDVARTLVGRLDRLDQAETEARFGELEADASDQLEEFSSADEELGETSFRRWLDLRYVGQFHTLTLPLPEGEFEAIAERLPELFHAAHMERYGHAAPEEPIEAITARVTAIREVGNPSLDEHASAEGTDAEGQTRRVLFEDGEWRECAVLRRADVAPGQPVHGPAVIEDGTTNIVLNERTTVERLPGDHLLVTLERRDPDERAAIAAEGAAA
ncbi:MAG TPA: hydantoinase/oxoprolinase family protein [Solirubrobacterales bacterium]